MSKPIEAWVLRRTLKSLERKERWTHGAFPRLVEAGAISAGAFGDHRRPLTASKCHRVIVEDESHEGAIRMQVSTIGIDLAKNVFQIHGVDMAGRVALTKKLRRSQVRSMTPVDRELVSR